jgi:hypothetical protein
MATVRAQQCPACRTLYRVGAPACPHCRTTARNAQPAPEGTTQAAVTSGKAGRSTRARERRRPTNTTREEAPDADED